MSHMDHSLILILCYIYHLSFPSQIHLHVTQSVAESCGKRSSWTSIIP